MNLFYREIEPLLNISQYVLSFWEFTVNDKDFAPIQSEIFPVGCVSLFYHRNDNYDLKQLALTGLNLETTKLDKIL